jgi:DNA-binding beta-propeller fold protein YncE
MYTKLLRLCVVAAAIAAHAATPSPVHAAAPTLEHERSFGRRISRAEANTNYPSGIAVDSNSGAVYVMDLLFNRIQKFDADGKFLLQWNCKQGLGLTVDPETGDVWVAMWLSHKVHKYSPEGELLLELGSGKASKSPGDFNRPHDLTVDHSNGDLYVLDTYNDRVQVFGRDGTFKKEWGGPFIQPFGISIHPKGEFLAVANTKNREVIKFTLDGEIIERYARAGHEPGEFRWPRGMEVGAKGNLFIADTDNERVQKLDSNANPMNIIKGPDDRERGTFHPRAVAVNHKTGEIYAAAAYSLRIDRFKADGTFIQSFAQGERDGPVFNSAKNIVIDPTSGVAYVSDWMGHRIRKFDKNGEYIGMIDGWIEPQTVDGVQIKPDFYTTPNTGMWPSKEYQSFPGPIDLDADGNLWMLRGSMFAPQDPRDQAKMLVRCFEPDGTFVRGIEREDFPKNARMRGLVVDDANQHVYVANTDDNKVMKFSFEGELLWEVGTKGAGNLQFDSPSGLQFDPKKGWLYVVDVRNNRVQILDSSGNFVKAFGEKGAAPGQFKFGEFSSIFIHESGMLIVADTKNHRVQFLDEELNYLGHHGEQGFGKHSRYNGVSGVAVHDDRLYVVDTAGGQVEVFTFQVN